jgi:hypothetical protein
MFAAIALSDIETRDKRMLSTTAGEELAVLEEIEALGCFLARRADGQEGFVKSGDLICFR